MQSMLLHQPAVGHMASLMRPHRQLRVARMQSQSGRTEPYNEGAMQVKRLVNRDRQQMLGNKVDILDKFESEFGDPSEEPSTSSARPAASAAAVADAPAASTSSSAGSGSSASSPAAAAAAAAKPAAPAAVKTNFGGGAGAPASPFGAASASRSTRSRMEPAGLSPDMSPDPIVKPAPTPGNLISRITLTQVVLFCTFSSMIGLMLATFSVVVKSGAVRLAGIE